MTHTSTEQKELTTAQECADYATSLRSTAMTIKLEGRTPPASFLRAAELFERAATELNLKDSRVQELEAERDEADRRAGRAERHMAGLNDDVRRFEAARRRMKAQWGVHDNVSFDVVWQQALDAKASQAQRVPLTDAQIHDWWRSENSLEDCDMCRFADFAQVVRAFESKYGITQEKQG